MEGTVLEISQQESPPISGWVWAVMDITDGEYLLSIHSTPEGAAKRMSEEKAKPLASTEHRLNADVAKWRFEHGWNAVTQEDIRNFAVYKKPVEE